ncbi:phosphomannomutase/phosphoglucomutase [Fusibacter sp. JL216-2]|uniref:phosphomannomutase/phosphoglucomutase n=1 Tax=Fusibacter sp. JL216-2 TaxID=3071453 RepID=UPI003D32E32D
MLEKWMKLQNGSDIRGVAVEGVEGEPVSLTKNEVELIAGSFVKWISEKTNKPAKSIKIAVGRDSRISGEDLMSGVLKGLTGHGASALSCGIASTPSMFMSTIFEETKCDGAIMITASHLPFNRNGMKFFTKDGGLDKPDIKAILTSASTYQVPENVEVGSISNFDLISRYGAHLVDYIRKHVNHPTAYNTPLDGLNIIVDAGNGAGGFFADKVLKPLGADIGGSQYLEPDGMFPNHVPNPEDPEAMKSIQEATIKTNADLGIIFDTDVDRAAIVDKGGKIINRNRLIALMSAIVLSDTPGTTIVTDSVTSDGLGEFIPSIGGKHHRFKRGYKNVINESVRLNQEGIHSALAIETSGHGALKENYFLDDGAFIVTKILVKLSQLRQENKSLSEIIADLREPKEAAEFRVKIKLDDFKAYGQDVIDSLNDFAKANPDFNIVPNSYEGMRLSCTSENALGWFLVRLSLHDPVLPINVESDVDGGVEIIANKLKAHLDQFTALDLSAFDK